jgi:hypothetical protein
MSERPVRAEVSDAGIYEGCRTFLPGFDPDPAA